MAVFTICTSTRTQNHTGDEVRVHCRQRLGSWCWSCVLDQLHGSSVSLFPAQPLDSLNCEVTEYGRECQRSGRSGCGVRDTGSKVPLVFPHLPSPVSGLNVKKQNRDLWCSMCLWVNISSLRDCQHALSERTSCWLAQSNRKRGCMIFTTYP